MPGMRLDFLKNPSQRAATGKSMPLKQVEAVLLYGKPEQRAKVVQKILPNVYSLCLNKASHHLLLTLLTRCDGLIRVQVLYHVRRKIIDLSMSPVGNIIVQEMLDKLPLRQKREIAEAFVLNTESDEFRRICEHPFGNHVAQKIMEHSTSREVVEEHFLPFIPSLAMHHYGQRVVVKYMESSDEGWRVVAKTLFRSGEEEKKEGAESKAEAEEEEDVVMDVEEEKISPLFQPAEENMIVSALVKHPLVPAGVKDALCAHLCEYAAEYLNPKAMTSELKDTAASAEEDEFALPDFGSGAVRKNSETTAADSDFPRYYHAYVAVFEQGDPAQRKELWESILSVPGLIEHIVSHKTAVAIAVAAFKTLPESQETIWKATSVFEKEDSEKKESDILDVARDPARTMVLRAVIEACCSLLTSDQKKRLAEFALELSQNPVSSPVLQKLLECFPDDESIVREMFENTKGELRSLVVHNAASYFIQAMLQCGSSSAVREELVRALLDAFSDIHEMLSFAQGSRVMQKLLAYASDEAVVEVVNLLLREAEEERRKHGIHDNDNGENSEAEEDEGNPPEKEAARISHREQREINRKKHYEVSSKAIVSYALHNHACYVIQAILRECCGRQLETQRKQIMNELKPFVFELAVSPWAGRVVLDTMTQSGSAKLGDMMKNVIFLKAEAWLSEVPAKGKHSGSGLDPTMRQALRRPREEAEGEKQEEDGSNKNNNNKKRPQRKMFRTIKK